MAGCPVELVVAVAPSRILGGVGLRDVSHIRKPTTQPADIKVPSPGFAARNTYLRLSVSEPKPTRLGSAFTEVRNAKCPLC